MIGARSQPHTGNLRISKYNTWDRAVVGDGVLSEDVSRGNPGLVGGHMSERGYARDIPTAQIPSAARQLASTLMPR